MEFEPKSRMRQNEPNAPEVNRRDFLKGGSLATLMTLLGGVELKAQQAEQSTPYDANKVVGAPVKCAVIGLGLWGRELLGTLARLPQADIAAVCDTYPSSLRRGTNIAPKASPVSDYRKILDDKAVKAVVVTTPTHQHKEIVLAALQAGKHVYCEAPLARTIEDARAIAQAAKAAPKQVFQAGLQLRSDAQRHFMLPFLRSGALGKWVMARAQWHKKQSWRQPSPNPDREKELNWKLRQSTSPGLIGEIGIHPVDTVTWFLNARPVSVLGFGAVREWNDDRDVPDTVQAAFEYPGGVQMTYDATLANSFDADYEMFYGSAAAIMLRGNRAWLFKEVDSPLLGWEVYARKETFYRETGIVIAAGATKLAAQADKPAAEEEAKPVSTPLSTALETFISNVNEVSAGVEDFTSAFNPNDTAALKKYLAGLTRRPAAGYKEGFEATVIALKASEAITKGQKVTFQPEWFELA